MGTCVAECPAGEVPSLENSCHPCPTAQPYADRIARACVSQCPDGKAPNQAKDCVKCEGATPYADHDAHACVATCPEGQAPRGGAESNSNDCVDCGEGLFADHIAHLCVEECPTGYLGKVPGDCVACEGNKPYVDRISVSSGICVETCPSASAPDSSGLECESCKGNKPFIDPEAKQCVSQCPEGTTPNKFSKECEQQLGEVSDPCEKKPYLDGTDCVDNCPAGKAPKNKAGDTEADKTCEPCCDTAADVPAGCASDEYADHRDHVCIASCPAGREYTLGRDCVPKCPDTGKRFLDASNCVDTCPEGQAPNDKGGLTAAKRLCEDCAADTFADHANHLCVAECPSDTVEDSATKECCSTC